MHLQLCSAAAEPATPTISSQDSSLQAFVFLGGEPDALSLLRRLHPAVVASRVASLRASGARGCPDGEAADCRTTNATATITVAAHASEVGDGTALTKGIALQVISVLPTIRADACAETLRL